MILRGLLGILTVAITLLVAGAMFVLATDSGSNWLAREAQTVAPEALHIGPVTGSLLAGVEIGDLEIRVGHTTIALQNVRARLAAIGLLRGRFEIAVLEIGRLAVATTSNPADKSPIRVPTIRTPIPVDLPDIRIATIVLRTSDFESSAADLQASASVDQSRLEIRELRGRFGTATFGLSGVAELRHPLPVQAKVYWSIDRPAWQGRGTIQGDLDLLRIQQTVDGTGSIAVQAELRGLSDRPLLDATASWEKVSYAFADRGAVTSSGGRLSVAGAWDGWHASLAAQLAAPKIQPGVAAVAVHGIRNHLTIDELRLGGPFGLVTGSGTADLGSNPKFAFDLIARDIDPASLRPDARGRLSARVRLSGQLPGIFAAQISGLEGALMGRPVAGQVSLGYRNGDWDFRDIDLSAGPNRLAGAGRVGDRIEGKFKLDAPRLDIIWPGLEGSVRGHGDIRGTISRPIGVLALSGRNLRAGDRRVRALEFLGRIESRETLQFNLDAADLVVGETHLGNLQARASGVLAQNELEARLSGGAVTASLAAHGGWTDGELREEITAATLSAKHAGEWRLQPTVLATGGRTHAEVADHCWLQGQGALCFANLRWSRGAVSLAAALRGYSAERLAELMPQDWVVAGTVAASLTLRHDGGGTYGNLSADLRNAALYFVGGDEPLVRIFPVARLSAEISPTVVAAEAEVLGDAGIELRANVHLDDPLSPAGALGGRVTGKMSDLGDILPLLIPGTAVSDISGRLTLDGVIGGTRAAPHVTGELALREGTVALPGLGVRLEAINLAARGNETATLAVEGSARSGGDVTLSGSIELTGEGAPAGVLRIRGHDLDAVRLPERYVRASPDLTLRYRAGRFSVDGTVEIPKADVVVRELPTTAVRPSPDVIVHDRPAPPSDRSQTVKIDGGVKLIFGDAVHLKAFGLDSRLAGDLRFYQTPDGYAAGEGVVRLEQGKFKAYGKELSIERGNLMFSGPLDNPGVDVRASRRVDFETQSVTVGLQLTGTAEHLDSRVFSDPAMGEADALSYLVAGRPLAKASAADQTSVASAAISLGLGQTAPITQQIGNAVALDELGFNGSGLRETEIVAGKQIGSDLYVRFAYGLFNHVGSVLARYRIGRRLSIEASSGEQQSLDLVYSIETN